MKRVFISLFILIFIYCSLYAQNYSGRISQNIFLAGNTADAATPDNLKFLRSAILEQTGPVTLIYSGDILHKNGLEKKPTAKDSAFIKSMLDVVKDVPNAKVYFIPGDEDWDNSGKNGWKDVKKLEELINGIAGSKVFLPGEGCPGPEIIDFGDNLQIVFINTPWLIHPHERPYAPDTKCDVLAEPQFIEQLEGALEDAEEKNVLIVGHHPAISNGNYGGRVPFLRHLEPPVLGTFIAGYHQNIGSPRDIAYPAYTEFANNMKYMMLDYAPFIYASSHDFNLQALEYQHSYQVVSGSIMKKIAAGKSKNTVFKSNAFGFVKLAYYDDGKVMMDAYELQKGNSPQVKSIELYQSSCNPDQSGAPVNTRLVPCREKIAPAIHMNPAFADSIGTAVGGAEYKAGFIKKIFLGSLYRSSWTATIQVPYLNLDTTKGGLTATGKGGGRQTHSLSLNGADGKSYVFRSVDKDPIKALDPILRKTFILGLSRQVTATQNPYGALPVSFMLNATRIFHAQPVLYILPDDPKLGMFQKEFGGLLGMLEEKPKKGKGDQPGTFGAEDVVRSFDLFRKLYKDHDNRVDAEAFARARVFDIWIGDWGRHEDNWKWAGFRSGNKTTYYPVPRDRDHAFSHWNGLLPYLISRHWALPNAEDFDYHFEDLSSLTWTARHLDRFLLSSLDKDDWLTLAKELQQTMNDNLIDSAIQQFPKATIPLSGNIIGAKLKSRRNELTKGIEEYYKLLAKKVDVVGSNKAEYFKITQLENGTVEVAMFDKDKATGAPSGSPLYHRIFIPGETKSVNVYGLDGDDVIRIVGSPAKHIVVRAFGGKGNDKIINSAGGKKIRIYDYNNEKNDSILSNNNSKVILVANRDLVEYNRQSFHYDTYLPLPLLYFSPDDGFVVGLGYTWTFHRFAEQGYSDRLNVSGRISTDENLQFKLTNEYHHAIGKWDWLIGGEVSQPYPAVYFYGAGNESPKLPDKTRDYYKSRFNGYDAFTGLQLVFCRRSSFNFTLYYKNNKPDTLSGDFQATPFTFFGEDDLNFFGANATIDLDFRDNPFAPKHGVRLFARQSFNHFNETDNENFANSEVSLEFYQTSRTFIPITLGIKGGAAHVTGDVPFYELNTVGRTTGLRGYERDRFAGNTTAYLDNQITVEFGRVNTAVAPLNVGVFGFYDVGRVWIPDEVSDTWHTGYGGGFYFKPLFDILTTKFSIAFSEEEKSGLFEFGLGLRL
ncbi:MAG TPA: hypothetical protein VE978_22365 [Chitinophagales bacterium]|nr:hypothetical protein [Chitinophagales bacterium]